MKKGKVVVVGAGIGGIAAAGRLARQGWSVTVLEKNNDQSTFPTCPVCSPCIAQPVRTTGCELFVIPLSNRITETIFLERMTG